MAQLTQGFDLRDSDCLLDVQAVGALGLEFRLLIAVEVVVLHSEGVDYRRAGSVTGCAIQHVAVELLSWLGCIVF